MKSLIPPDELRGHIGPGDFQEVGESFFELFKELGGLKPHHRVLDVGCGSGRMSAPLTRFLTPPGAYEGFDVTEPGVRWCRQAYRDFPHFRFQHVDVASGFYHTTGESAANYRFPYGDGDFDFVFLASVFTHMMSAAVERYMDEIVRVLTTGGVCFITYFVLNEVAMRRAESSQDALQFSHVAGPRWATDLSNPEAAVGYDEEYILKLYSDRGLVMVHPPYAGWWSAGWFTAEAKTMQDVVVARKP